MSKSKNTKISVEEFRTSIMEELERSRANKTPVKVDITKEKWPNDIPLYEGDLFERAATDPDYRSRLLSRLFKPRVWDEVLIKFFYFAEDDLRELYEIELQKQQEQKPLNNEQGDKSS
jgi:hypothetical protein